MWEIERAGQTGLLALLDGAGSRTAVFCVSPAEGAHSHLRHFPRFVVGSWGWMGYLLTGKRTGRKIFRLRPL